MGEDSSPKKLAPISAQTEALTLEGMRHELSHIHEILSQFDSEKTRLNQVVTELKQSNAELKQSHIKLEERNAKLEERNAKLEERNTKLEELNAKLLLENQSLTKDLEAANSRIIVLEDHLSRSWREKERSEKGGTGTSGEGDSGNNPPSGGNGGGGGGGDGPKSYKALYLELLQVADRDLNWHIFAANAQKSPQRFWLSIGSAYELIPPVEDLMATSQTKEIDSKKNLRFSQEEKLAMFNKTKGIHSSLDTSVRYDVTLRVEKITVTHETLRDESQPGVGDQCLTARKTCNSCRRLH